MAELINPIARARLYRMIASVCGQQLTARLLRTSRPNVANTVRLLQLEPRIRRLVSAGKLSAGHGRALLALDDPDQRVAFANRAVARAWSVRRVEQEVANSHG